MRRIIGSDRLLRQCLGLIVGTAALIAMAYVIVSEGLHDQAYCDRHVLGFDDAHLPPGAPAGASYKSYLMGESDGVPKTPEWAAALTGVPADALQKYSSVVMCRVHRTGGGWAVEGRTRVAGAALPARARALLPSSPPPAARPAV